jgi:hypothetical protein
MKIDWNLVATYALGILLASLVLAGIKVALDATGMSNYEEDSYEDYESYEDGGDFE